MSAAPLEFAGPLSLAELAPLLGPEAARMQAWTRPYRTAALSLRPLVRALPDIDGELRLHGPRLAQAVAVTRFRQAGVPLRRIWRANELLTAEFGAAPFARLETYVDGRDILARADEDALPGGAPFTVERDGRPALRPAVTAVLDELRFEAGRAVAWTPRRVSLPLPAARPLAVAVA
jgi:hypothetical protein